MLEGLYEPLHLYTITYLKYSQKNVGYGVVVPVIDIMVSVV